MNRATRVPQRVLIVGGGSEIGSALARAWLAQGAEEFILVSRPESSVDVLVQEIERSGRTAKVLSMDALDRSSIAPMIEAAWSVGDIDMVVISIGLLGDQRAIESDPGLAWEVLSVNATASIQIALEAANRLEAQQYGSLILLSSVAGLRGRRDNYVYGASKAALDAFGEGLQQRLSNSGVKVLIARPGYVRSRMSAGVPAAPFAVSVDRSRDQILGAVARGDSVVWIPPVLGLFFFLIRFMPRKAWARVVGRWRSV